MLRSANLRLAASACAAAAVDSPTIAPTLFCPNIMHNYAHPSGVHSVTLSREKALNSMTYEMIKAVHALYAGIRREVVNDRSSVGAVLIKGSGPKAFCAGGDVVGLRQDPNIGKSLFYTKYQVNYNLMTLPVPHVAFWDGIVMGAGVGMSIHGSHRLTSEKATFAMPETAIGLFPDVGGTWFLPRVKPDGLGLFMSLTGCRLKGADLVHAGVGTHFVPSELMPQVEEAIRGETGLRSAADKRKVIDDIVAGVVGDKGRVGDFALAPHLSQIANCFGAHVTSVEDVLARLQADGSEWALKQRKALLGFSPMSLKLSFALFRRGASLTCPKDMFALEYRSIVRCVTSANFHSGVTALLIDKTGKPTWQPSTLEGVTDAMVEAYMGPTSYGVEWDAVKPFPTTA